MARVIAELRTSFEQNPPGGRGLNRETIRARLGVGMPKANAATQEAIRLGLARIDKAEGGAVFVPQTASEAPEDWEA